MAPLKSPADKIPLVARKNLRDVWEAKRSEYEATISELLSTAWNIQLNPNLIYQYANDDYKSRLGDVITWYMDAFVYNLKTFVDSFSDDGIQELNSACSKHQLVFTPQEETKFTYGGLVVKESVLHLVFADDGLGVNVDDVSKDFAQALKEASFTSTGSTAFNLIARNAVRKDYDPEIDRIRSAIAELVNIPELKLNPNFDSNATQLAKSSQQVGEDWDKRIGWITLAYFDGLKTVLERENFKNDDMQQEAFQEAVEMGQICVRILPKWEDGQGRYNEVRADEGVLYIQTTIENWGVNVDDAALKLLDIL